MAKGKKTVYFCHTKISIEDSDFMSIIFIISQLHEMPQDTVQIFHN